ncbi:auxin efflux carrier [Gyrodon lividus]|nr:auxin efflux carrier [Gyrodon lividus]
MHIAGTPVIPILFTVFQSIFQVFLLCLAGYILCWKGIVDKPTSKVLNHINIALFTPALLFSKVAFFLTPAKLRELWIIPIFFVVVTGLSGLVANALARACRLNRSQVNFATAASMFMNSNSLPVALMQSLASTVPLLKWGPEDSIDAMFGRSLTYLVMFSTLGMMLRWSYGVRILSQADEGEPQPPIPQLRLPGGYRDEEGSDTLTRISVERPAVAHTGRLIDYDAGEVETDGNGNGNVSIWRGGYEASPRALPHPHAHLPAVPTFLESESESESWPESESEETLGAQSSLTALSTEAHPNRGVHTPTPSSSQSQHSRARTSWLSSHLHSYLHTHRPRGRSRLLHVFALLGRPLSALSPPLLASLTALITALLPPLQAALNSNAVAPVRGALEGAGGCSVPVTLIVLGGWFWNGEARGEGRKGHGKGVRDENAGGQGEGVGVGDGRGAELDAESVRGDANSNPNTTPTPTTPASSTPTPQPTSTPPHSPSMLHPPHDRPQSPSRNSSTTSTSSSLSAFGDVLLSKMHVHPRASARPELSPSPFRSTMRFGRTVRGTKSTDCDTANPTNTSKSRLTNAVTACSTNAAKSHLMNATTTLTAQPPHPSGESLTIFVTLLSRMVLVPMMLTPLMVVLRTWGGGGGVFDDPVFIVSSMLLMASPPALTLAQISQRAHASTHPNTETLSPFERLLSRTVFWAYCVLTPPITVGSVMVGLVLVGMSGGVGLGV